jgi:hypothetical protein
MEPDQFRLSVYESASSELSLKSVRKAISAQTVDRDELSLSNQDVWEASQLAAKLGTLSPGSRRKRESKELLPGTPWTRLMEERMLAAVGDWVEEVRTSLRQAIGTNETSEGPPFSTLRAAANWIEQEGGFRGFAADFEQTRFDQLEHEVEVHLAEMQRMIRSESYICEPGERLFLAYAKPDSTRVEWIAVDPDSLLAPLARIVPQIARATGFQEAQLTMHILTGIRPSLGLVVINRPTVTSVDSPNGKQVHHKEVVVRFRSPELSKQQLREIHHHIRKTWGSRGTKPLTIREETLVKVVEHLRGGEDEDGLTTWNAVTETLNKRLRELGEKQFSTSDAVRVAYRRALKRSAPAIFE